MHPSISFPFDAASPQEGLQFDLSSRGHINSAKYSLLEVLNDQRLGRSSLDDRLDIMGSYLDDLRAANHYMYRRLGGTGCLPLVQILDGPDRKPRQMINLASNDYLNLSQHPRVKEAAVNAIKKYGLGSGSAPMLSGTTDLHRQLEERVAAFKSTEDAMLHASGYAANIGTLRALLHPDDAAICDMYAHASLMDGCTHASKYYFKHNDIASLEMALKKAAGHRNKLVIVDGVYSMDGDIARLEEIVDMAHRHGAWVVVDEAHSDGVLGPNGRGTLEHFGMRCKVDVFTGTFSKGIGSVGGYVAGSRRLIQYLQVACRSYMFASSAALPTVAGVLAALDVIEEEPGLRERVLGHADYFRERARGLGFECGESATPIIPLIIGDDYKVKEMAWRLHQAGILVNPVPYPAVPKRLTRIRVSLTAGLSRAQLDHCLEEIARVATEMGILRRSEFRKSA